MSFTTAFGSLAHYEKGHIEIINDNPKYYVFSNIFEVAAKSKPWEKVAVGKNLEYVIEAIRAEGTSPWMACSHDEFAVVMDGEVEVEYVKLDSPDSVAPPNKEGTVLVQGEPRGRRMGVIKLKRGHQALLPKGAAYRFKASKTGVMMQQTILGDLTVQKWAEICYQ
ncbi:MAG TPA: hydroxyquinol 1,2-dioxygenase [Burkholderiales bacterium]|nr:hydroxyquinol 1,2-dioxygenase [Burkholderiales bacterium]